MQNPVIGIIGGKGRMGHLFAQFFKDRGLKVIISDKKTKLSNIELAKKADISIVSVPIDITEKIIKEIIPHMPKTSALMDFTSVKEMPVKAMLKAKCEVMGIHPMFGDSNPIPGQTIILCHTRKSKNWSEWMEDFLHENGAQIQKMTPREHDQMMSLAQGMIHFADITFADALRRLKLPAEDLMKFTSKASELKIQLAARVIDQDSGLYGNIQIENPNNIKAIKAYQKSVNEYFKIIKKKDLSKFKRLFDSSKSYFGKYAKEAYEDSSTLIDKLQEMHARRKNLSKTQNPKKNDIAILGPENTYSHIAAEKYLNENKLKNKIYFAKSIEEVFDFVAAGKTQKGIIPIENKLHGTVRETLDGLFAKKVRIKEDINLTINHVLIAQPHAEKKDIKVIISHSQALNQCKKYIKKNFPKAELKAYASTAAAIEYLAISNKKNTAAIGTEFAAVNNDLKILDKNIQDEKENSTTFVVIEKGEQTLIKIPQTKSQKTSIAFYFKSDSPGSLFSVFKDFSDAKINMTKIESRPTKAGFGEYIFFLDFDGDLSDVNVKKALQKIKKKVARLKILGSY